MIVWEEKDPDEISRREIDWEKHPSWNRYDTIASSSFTLSTPSGMSVSSQDNNCLNKSWVFLTGGTEGAIGKVLAEVTTQGGQTLQWTARMKIESR